MAAPFSVSLQSLDNLFVAPPINPSQDLFAPVAGIDYLLRQIDAAHRTDRVGREITIVLANGDKADAAEVQSVIQRYCKNQIVEAERSLRLTRRHGRQALWIGLPFLALCLGLAGVVSTTLGDTAIGSVLFNGLTIAGWVALWRPAELLLYEWWPFWHRIDVLKAMMRMPVRVTTR